MSCDCMLYINTLVYSLCTSEKAGLLVTGIKDKVKLDPKKYHKFVDHLSFETCTGECTETSWKYWTTSITQLYAHYIL